MTTLAERLELPRPAPAPDPGPLDDHLYDLVERRVRRLVGGHPVLASSLGIHTEDDHLGDPSRDAVLDEIEADRAHLAAVDALDPSGLSAAARFERDLEVHDLRLALFEADELRAWERRAVAAGEIGDAVFLLLARGAAPLAERLGHITARLEHAPAFLDASRTRAVGPQVGVWQRAIVSAGAALERHQAWIRETLADATEDWPLGTERYDELIRRRAFGDLDPDAILSIGTDQLAANLEARRAAGREIDPRADLPSLIERLKADHPATFEEALDGYRDAMDRARAHLVARDLATIPPDERIEVIATPEYLRAVMPFAAYFSPARFDADQRGIYIVTPAVDDDPHAMNEHYYASISNTSIHEAYPGHHLQLSVAARHPSLTRMLTSAPEFEEGWGMYSEQMMREEGFDDGPEFRFAMYTDAIWRACRIVLDVRMHRGELTPDEAIDFLVEHTGFERANARAEVRRYTYTPGYQLSYLLGKVLLLGLREEEKRRLGADFSLKAFHDSLLRNGSLPISFHRRALRGEG
jgi:uncharacterized protein (DUF885 family)